MPLLVRANAAASNMPGTGSRPGARSRRLPSWPRCPLPDSRGPSEPCDLLTAAQTASRPKERDTIQTCDLPITIGLQESMHHFRLEQLATHSAPDRTPDWEIQAAFPDTIGELGPTLAQSFKIPCPDPKDPRPAPKPDQPGRHDRADVPPPHRRSTSTLIAKTANLARSRSGPAPTPARTSPASGSTRWRGPGHMCAADPPAAVGGRRRAMAGPNGGDGPTDVRAADRTRGRANTRNPRT
ncbi:DUF1931 family protein [Streptomyces tauricus]